MYCVTKDENLKCNKVIEVIFRKYTFSSRGERYDWISAYKEFERIENSSSSKNFANE